jgi:hypothetical protein
MSKDRRRPGNSPEGLTMSPLRREFLSDVGPHLRAVSAAAVGAAAWPGRPRMDRVFGRLLDSARQLCRALAPWKAAGLSLAKCAPTGARPEDRALWEAADALYSLPPGARLQDRATAVVALLLAARRARG